MIDASRGFVKDGNKNRLRPRDMHQIIDTFTNRKEVDRYSRLVPLEEIADPKNDYNLNIQRYIDNSERVDIQDLHGHLSGGIPHQDLDDLQPYWAAFPSLRGTLFGPLRQGYSELIIDKHEVQTIVSGSAEFRAFQADTSDECAQWWAAHRPALVNLEAAARSSEVIEPLAEDLLDRFRERPLIDEYGIYEQLMRYWNDTMHDDVALVVVEGWLAASGPRPARIIGEDKDKKPIFEPAHFVFGTGVRAERWVTDLIPPELVIHRYLSAELAKVERLDAVTAVASQEVADYIEEHAVEDGLLFESADSEGKLSSKLATDCLKALRADAGDPDEIMALTQVVQLFRAEAAAKKAARDARVALQRAALAQYAEFTAADVQSLVIDDKWGAEIAARVDGEVNRLRERLTSRLRALADRYESTLAQLDAEVDSLSQKVAAHLVAMGVEV
jgi:type I restriction enzyme M protein